MRFLLVDRISNLYDEQQLSTCSRNICKRNVMLVGTAKENKYLIFYSREFMSRSIFRCYLYVRIANMILIFGMAAAP